MCSEQLRTSIDEAREAVWNLRQKPPALSLVPLLRSVTDQISREFGVAVEFGVSGKSFEFQRDTIHEVLMVVREAIYNAVRHGHPSTVKLNIYFENNKCELRIADDGTGFDPQTLSSQPLGHYGLIGMQERVLRIGGRLAVNSHPSGGTEVIMHIPRGASPTAEKSELQVRL